MVGSQSRAFLIQSHNSSSFWMAYNQRSETKRIRPGAFKNLKKSKTLKNQWKKNLPPSVAGVTIDLSAKDKFCWHLASADFSPWRRLCGRTLLESCGWSPENTTRGKQQSKAKAREGRPQSDALSLPLGFPHPHVPSHPPALGNPSTSTVILPSRALNT